MKQFHLVHENSRAIVWLDKDVSKGEVITLRGHKHSWTVYERYKKEDQPAWWWTVDSRKTD